MIAQAVRDYLAKQPFLAEALSEGMINMAGLARKLKPILSRTLNREVQEGAIVMALKRMAPDTYIMVSRRLKLMLSKLGDYTIRSQINIYTLRNSQTLLRRQQKLLSLVGKDQNIFYSFTQGIHESTLVASQVLHSQITEVLKTETLIHRRENLSSISIMLPQDNIETSGLYYFIFRQLAWEDINILEVISTTNEFTIVVEDDEVDRGFQVLRRLKS